jgi:NADPH:quinone reductase-like Zn-dependent oxidoreductase
VTRFKKGDQVFGMVNFEGHGKAYAEYVAAPEAHLAIKPASVTHEEAAAATLAAITAWQALVTYGKIKKGDKVLIHSAAGGVGHYAVQIAKHFSAFVVGTSSLGNKDFVLGLGADEHIDYATQKFEELVTDADLVVDSLGIPGHLDRSLAALKKGGRFISLFAHFADPALLEKIKDKQVFAHRLGVTTEGGDINNIAALIEKGVLRSYISRVYGFNEIPAAHEQVITARAKGKIVVSL